MKFIVTPCYLCDDVVREGWRRFDRHTYSLSHMSSGWFDCTEPSLSTLLQRKQGVQGAYAFGRGGSSTSNLREPSRTTSSQREQGVESFVT